MCRDHGVWLDARELEQIVAAIRSRDPVEAERAERAERLAKERAANERRASSSALPPQALDFELGGDLDLDLDFGTALVNALRELFVATFKKR